jgi:hypothetical protein
MTNPTPDEAQIRETAYLFWLDEGQPVGRDQEHWLKAIDALTPAAPKKARKTPAKTRTSSAKPAVKAAPKAAKTKAAAKKPAKAKAKA